MTGTAAARKKDNTSLSDDALLADALLGDGLPPQAEAHLRQAGLSYHEDAVAEDNLEKARQLAPDHAAVLIGFYRFYFYKGRLEEALGIARICLAKAIRDNHIQANDWRSVRATDAVFDQFDALLPRFFMFTLKGYAYLNMRLGNIEEGKEAVRKLLELDPKDKIGAGFLLDVAVRMGLEEDD